MKNIYENIKDICLSHQLINDYGSGDIFRLNDLKDVKYPIIWTELNQTDLNYTQINPSFKFYYVDRLKDDQTDASEIEVDAGYILNDIINSISSFYQILSISTVTPFSHKFFDMTAGGYIDVQLSDCSDGVGVVQSIESSTPNLLPSEYVSYSGTTLKDALDQLNFASYTSSLTSLESSISIEESTRVEIDTILYTLISSETSSRISADSSLISAIESSTPTGLTSLETSLSNETSNRISVDSSLNSKISTETSQRISVDSSLSTVLSTETSNRISVDSSLNSKISTETSQRISVDSSLSTVLSTETSQRISVDSSLNNIISTEISTRTSADSSLEIKINSINQSMILRLMV